MKNFIFSLMILLAGTSSAHAKKVVNESIPGTPIITAKLTYQNISSGHKDWFGKVKKEGTISLDFKAQQAILFFARENSCPRGRVCAQVAPSPAILRLPLLSSSKDSCGAITYKAEADRRHGDGSLIRLEITDNLNNHCESMGFAMRNSTEVLLFTENPRIAKEFISNFAGERLVEYNP